MDDMTREPMDSDVQEALSQAGSHEGDSESGSAPTEMTGHEAVATCGGFCSLQTHQRAWRNIVTNPLVTLAVLAGAWAAWEWSHCEYFLATIVIVAYLVAMKK